MMRVAVALLSYFAVAFAVPVPPDSSPLETPQRGDMPLSQTETSRRLSPSTQAQLTSQAQSWAPQFTQHVPVSAYQLNPNVGLPLLPAQTQYQPVYQMPQLVYFPMFGAQDRNPTLSYAMPTFYPGTSVHSPANSGLTVSASMPSVPGRPAPRVQTQLPPLREHGQSPRQQLQQPFQQQTPQIVYVVQQPMRQSFDGISSEELQAQGRLGRLGRPQLVTQLVPQLGTSISPGSAGPFVPLRQPPIQPLNPGFPAISSAPNPVLFPSVPSIQLRNPVVPNPVVPNPVEETGEAERMPPSASSPSHDPEDPDEFEKTLPTNPTAMTPTVMTDTASEPTASVANV